MKKLVSLAAIIVALAPVFASAQTAPAKSYRYASIVATITINKDSTLDVAEDQTFAFTGNFHFAERDIALDKISAVTDVNIVDDETGQPLAYASGQLNELDPASDGKFTYWSENGFEKIKWYYNLADTTHAWTIHYKVHGAISFEQPYDRLYWNIFSAYTVPIDHVGVSVVLPEKVAESDVNLTAYRTSNVPFEKSFTNGDTFAFAAEEVSPGEAFTIDVTWPKNIVSQQAFYRDFLALYWFDILAGIIVAASLLTMFFWWLFAIKLKERPGLVIAQYEPPEHLRPAIAEMVTKETVTSKGLAATIVDLAIRKYITITDETPDSFFARTMGKFVYRVTLIKELAVGPKLQEYEKNYLEALLSAGDGKSVSTKDLKKAGLSSQVLFAEISEVRKMIKKEANVETGAFVKEKWKMGGVKGWALAGFLAILFVVGIAIGHFPAAILAAISIAVAVWYVYAARRRTAQGKILRDEWLGFKLYLEVAERYRMQNLTPDLFEKYLPYAMIFGIEKKWAQAFEARNISVPAPVWYVGATGHGVGGAGNFSPVSFSASFSSSFSSAFASSAGGGGGGFGGGGAGGGGGGGGGGAG